MEDLDAKLHEKVRNSFPGKSLTSRQLDKAIHYAGIIKREIDATGSFLEPLTDNAHAFARSERFDAVRGETHIREVFEAVNGVTMNQMRERYAEHETQAREHRQEQALAQARSVMGRIQDGDTMPFYRAYDDAAVEFARQHEITELAAKNLMKETFKQAEGRELYEVGKEFEAAYHLPVREAERAQRKIAALERQQSYSR